MFELTAVQQAAITSDQTNFLLGSAGTGKTTALQQRLLHLLHQGEPAYTLLVLVAELPHRQQWLNVIHQSGLGPYADLKITTYNRLAQEMVTLFWPLVARPAGFERPFLPPTVLTYDLAQLLMWHIITPMIDDGAFADLRLRPQQIVSQILDTLNRAALNGLTLDNAIDRQIATWVGEEDRIRHLHEAARAARAFRRVCLENSLLDLSLVVETFDSQLVQHPEFHRYFQERFLHLLIDNVEEQTPAGQNFIANLMDVAETTTIAYDAGGGYKRFLAADPLGANQFRSRCVYAFDFGESLISPPAMTHLANVVENYLMHTQKPTAAAAGQIMGVVNGRYRREMIARLVEQLVELRATGVHPSQIAIITPYLDGALRYSLTQALSEAGLPYFLLRRRSSPREEPRVRAWLTWLALAHPQWQRTPKAFDVAEALTLSIAGLDPARAALLVEWLYDEPTGELRPVDHLPERIGDRVGQDFVALLAELRDWLLMHNGRFPIDHFLHKLFNDLLAQPRFQPEPDLAGAAVCEWLVQAATRLRQSAPALGLTDLTTMGAAFIDGIHQGLVTANPPDLGEPPDPNGIMISTIYGYLLAGYPVQVQVWLETAAQGWWDIPRQPLSNAFVLAQSWDPQQPWTMDDDFFIKHQLLSRLVRGLCHRCTAGVILANSDLDRRGQRQDGPLWRALQPLLVTAVP